MSEDLKNRIKTIKKKMDLDYERVIATDLNKTSTTRQNELFNEFLNGLSKEIKKDSNEAVYLAEIIKSFKNTKLTTIRYAIEKSFDRYSRIIQLMKQYDDNFDEDEILKYEIKYGVLNNILSFMVSNSIGEYSEDERKITDS